MRKPCTHDPVIGKDLLVPETVRTILENRDCFNMKKWGWLLAEELNVSVEPDCIYQCQNDDFKLLEKILYAWCAKLGHHATLSRLRNIFEMMGKMYVAEALSELGDRSAWGKNFSTKEFPSSSKTLPDEILHRRFTYEPNDVLLQERIDPEQTATLHELMELGPLLHPHKKRRRLIIASILIITTLMALGIFLCFQTFTITRKPHDDQPIQASDMSNPKVPMECDKTAKPAMYLPNSLITLYISGGYGINDNPFKFHGSYFSIGEIYWTGSISMHDLLKILSQTKNLMSIYLENIDFTVNLRAGRVHSHLMNLNRLERLYLKQVDSRLNILSTLSSVVLMENLQVLHVDAKSLTKADEPIAENILYGSYASIKRVFFPGYKWSSWFMKNNQRLFSQLTELHIDAMYFDETHISIPEDICTVFPALETFTSLLGSFSTQDLPKFLTCMNLKQLTIGISVTPEHTYVNLNFLQQLRNLEELNLRVYFSLKLGGGNCAIDDEEALRTKFNATIDMKC